MPPMAERWGKEADKRTIKGMGKEAGKGLAGEAIGKNAPIRGKIVRP